MASIRLFGRGRNQAAPGGSPVSAAQIADLLADVATASLSATWRCRHGAGTSIGEGAVDFTARRSRATVIRGKYTFEYVRSGSTVYRALVPDEDEPAAGAKPAESRDAAVTAPVDPDEVDEDAEADLDEEDEADGFEAQDGDDAEDIGLDDEAEDDGEVSEDDLDDAELDEDEDSADPDQSEDSGESALSAEASEGGQEKDGGDGRQWQRFSENDACGLHAYAEPGVLAAAVRAAAVVAARDAQEFDGVTLAAYAVTLKPKPNDPDRVLARLARHLRDHGANVVVVTAFVDESGSGEIDLTGEASEDGADSNGDRDGDGAGPRIVRVRVELPHWTPADDPTADHAVSVDLFEFGEPVRIEVPDGGVRRTSRTCADLALF